MSRKLPLNAFKWVQKPLKFNERFIKSYNENSDKEYFLEVDVEYPQNLLNSHKDLPFLPERKKMRKVEKLICGIEDKEKCYSYKNPKTSIESRTNYRKSTQSNSI